MVPQLLHNLLYAGLYRIEISNFVYICIFFLSHQFIGTRQGEAFQLSLVEDRGHFVNSPSRKKIPTSSLGFDVSAKITDLFFEPIPCDRDTWVLSFSACTFCQVLHLLLACCCKYKVSFNLVAVIM